MRTFATLFSGGEGAGVGLQAAGLSHLWGVEHDPAIAAVARANGFDVTVADVRAVDYVAMPRADWLHASPSCTRASVANANATEAQEDIEAAQAVCRALAAQEPDVFTLENVWGYRTFAAFRLICDQMGRMGYFWTYSHENAADYGVPQTRRRLILRASRGLLPHLPAPVPWAGWYAAIEDLLPTLPESRLAPWQLARLPEELRGAVLVTNGKAAPGREDVAARFFWQDEAAGTVTSQAFGRTRAVLLDMHNAARDATVRGANEPCSTQGSSMASRPSHQLAVLPSRVVSMTPRCLARFQSVPDSYILPDKRTLAAKVIGNMVPPLLMQRIAENMLEALA